MYVVFHALAFHCFSLSESQRYEAWVLPNLIRWTLYRSERKISEISISESWQKQLLTLCKLLKLQEISISLFLYFISVEIFTGDSGRRESKQKTASSAVVKISRIVKLSDVHVFSCFRSFILLSLCFLHSFTWTSHATSYVLHFRAKNCLPIPMPTRNVLLVKYKHAEEFFQLPEFIWFLQMQ